MTNPLKITVAVFCIAALAGSALAPSALQFTPQGTFSISPGQVTGYSGNGTYFRCSMGMSGKVTANGNANILAFESAGCPFSVSVIGAGKLKPKTTTYGVFADGLVFNFFDGSSCTFVNPQLIVSAGSGYVGFSAGDSGACLAQLMSTPVVPKAFGIISTPQKR